MNYILGVCYIHMYSTEYSILGSVHTVTTAGTCAYLIMSQDTEYDSTIYQIYPPKVMYKRKSTYYT